MVATNFLRNSLEGLKVHVHINEAVTVSTGVVAVLHLIDFLWYLLLLFNFNWLLQLFFYHFLILLLKHFVDFMAGIAFIFDGTSSRASVHFLVGYWLRGVEVEALVLEEVEIGAQDAGDELVLYI